MVSNIGPADRVVRIAFAAIIAFFYWMGLIPGTFGLLLSVLGAALFVTAVVGFCPVYRAMDLDSHVHDEG